MKTHLVVVSAVALLGACTIVARSCGIWPFNGVVVVISNTGSTDYESCVVNVTGNSYELGSLAVGDTVATNVSPTGESHVELDLTEYNGSKHNLIVDCYFERRGYSGTISIDLDGGQIRDVAIDVGIGIP